MARIPFLHNEPRGLSWVLVGFHELSWLLTGLSVEENRTAALSSLKLCAGSHGPSWVPPVLSFVLHHPFVSTHRFMSRAPNTALSVSCARHGLRCCVAACVQSPSSTSSHGDFYTHIKLHATSIATRDRSREEHAQNRARSVERVRCQISAVLSESRT